MTASRNIDITAMEKTEVTDPETINRLLFRRQFVLGPTPFAPTRHWSSLLLPHGLNLSAHEDLRVFSDSNGGVTVTLVGIAVDPLNPGRTEPDIVRSMLTHGASIEELIDCTIPLIGRWVIIYQNRTATHLFTDPCGLRQVFYFSDGYQFWCGSQPEIINANRPMSLNSDRKLLQFLMSPNLARTESAWIGTQTPYKDCFHLLPNHYLDVNNCERVRFYPNEPICEQPTSTVVARAKEILQGAFEAITRRHKTVMALTAGWDSRVLLAASRALSGNLQNCLARNGVLPEDAPDVWVPRLLAEKLDIDFVVRNSCGDVPGWFISALSRNVTNARVLPKTRSIYANYINNEKRININGNASEICRDPFFMYSRYSRYDIPTNQIAQIFDYAHIPFVLEEIEQWKSNLNPRQVKGVDMANMFYWEERVGNWGAQYPAEQDIAIEEITPFNCRLLIQTLQSSPRQVRAYPDYQLYRDLIEEMWPDVLSLPINPRTKHRVITVNRGEIKERIRQCIPTAVIEPLKRILNRGRRVRA